MKKHFLILAVQLLLNGLLNAQTINRARLDAGLGSIAGISPSVTTLDAGLAMEFSTNIFGGEQFRGRFFYSRKFEYFIPENREGRYYPYLKGFSFEYLITEESGGFEFQEGLGAVFINDGIFSPTNNIYAGIMFSFDALLPLHEVSEEGFGLAAGLNYGITFDGDQPRYFAIDFSLYYDF